MLQKTTEEITSQFFSLMRDLKRHINFKNPLLHMPLAHTETLRLIHEKKHLAMKEIAGFLAITPPSATALINNLVKVGYVQRSSSKADRRGVYLSLTKKGTQILKKSLTEHCRRLDSLLNRLNLNEQKQFLSLFKKMVS
jgi:DNA-binding MarR family transcriptional regulator